MLFPRLFVLLCCLAMGVPSARAELADMPLAPGAFRWADDGAASGPLYLIVSIARQRVHVYRGDRLIGAASVSTGTKGHRTPTGSFPILQKRQWHRSNLYSNAPMPFMQRLTWDGIALHAGHNPGYPASHGCIRLPYAFARQLFALTQIGTLTEVTSNRLNAAILLDPLVVGDAGSSVVTFGMGGSDRRTGAATRVPLLEIDPDIFGVWGRR
ncbi:L,D-transpeptidase family protein [Sphingobium sp. AS12]|uniref:L,D-transpeptidase family protein n=1 Tax=Sphingobium sp. AS12 TaxID=2849495 RepID=UPI001C3152B3|nr:L,D-transpeptidase family protein [Sphingobium sp. AS12]MBV2148491.1 L,D-transpeptidase family protein [Sphingobium sp. AS12]